jgi:hypothetical protein
VMKFWLVGTVALLRACDRKICSAGGRGHRTTGEGSYVTLSVAWIAPGLKLWLCGEEAVSDSLSRDTDRYWLTFYKTYSL